MRWALVSEFPKYEVSDAGGVRLRDSQKPVPQRVTPRGYKSVSLFVAGRKFERLVHRLVAGEFCEGVGPVVRHLDGTQANNHYTNLAWGTISENSRDSVAHGTHNMASKTECKHGHPFNEENTKARGSARRCRTCQSRHDRDYRERKRLTVIVDGAA